MTDIQKDWTQPTSNIFITLGASNHTSKERHENDFYATDPIAIDNLLSVFDIDKNIYEPACGQGHLAKRLQELNYNVYSSDLVNRGFGTPNIDFLHLTELPNKEITTILTNPPYKYATEFVLKSLELLPTNGYCIMFLKTTFLETKKRYDKLFSTQPPKYIFQFVKRVLCAKNADFQKAIDGGGSAVSYAWFVWQKGFNGDTILRWINN